jgi:endo-1,4-beta-xylanase
MKITGQGFQALMLVALAVAGSKHALDKRNLATGNESSVEVVVASSEAPFAAPEDGCRRDSTALWTLRQDRRVNSAPSLRQTAGLRGLMVGTAVEPGFLAADASYRSIVSDEFSTLTPENVMKFDHIHPARESYSFCDSDALLSYAAANHMQVRGHTLVWHQQLPEWLSRGEFSREELITILRDHIHTVVGRYRGQIAAWDVVNEAFESDGSLRDSLWLRGIGPEYIEMAFGWAHQADPDALLFYNDFGAEALGAKSDAIYGLLARLRKQGVPVHGAGLQMHLEAGAVQADEIKQNMRRLAELGLEIHVTEMDVRVALPATEEKLLAQAETYREVVGACVAVEACRSITFWGVTDRHSWIESAGLFRGFGSALLLDEAYEAKPAYHSVRHALEDDTLLAGVR